MSGRKIWFTHKLLSGLPSFHGEHVEQVLSEWSLEFASTEFSGTGAPNFGDGADEADAVDQKKDQHWAVEEYELAGALSVHKAYSLSN